jgi:PPOX class probable F420-dependent enzyme
MVLSPGQRAFVEAARRAILATVAPDGSPRLVPVCFVLDGERLVSPLDEKPKTVSDPRELARVRDILARPRVSLLVERWDEDWSRLAWVRLAGKARLLEPVDPAHARSVAALREKYPPYLAQAIDRRPMIEVAIDAVRAWGELG